MLSKSLQKTFSHEKILFNNVVILLGWTTLHGQKLCAMLLKRLQITLHRKKPNVIWIASLFGNFHFELVDFLITTSCCKSCANFAQIFPTLQKKIPGPTLKKKTKLYWTAIPFFLLKISNKISYEILDAINFNIYLRSFPKAMTDRGKKKGRWKYSNTLNILRMKRDF